MELRPDISNELSKVQQGQRTFFRSPRDGRPWLYALSMLLDQMALIGGYLAALQFRNETWLSADGKSILLVALPVFTMLAIAREVQSVESLHNRLVAIARALGALAGAAFVTIGLIFLSDADEISRLGLATTFGLAAVLIVIGKFTIDWLRKLTLGENVLATIVLDDGIPVAHDANCDIIDVKSQGLWPDPNRPDHIDLLSRLIAPYDRVLVGCERERLNAWATFLRGHDIGGEIILDADVLSGAVAVGRFGDNDTLIISKGPLDLSNRFQKRLLDLLAASLALVLLLPLLLVVALAIKIDTRGPIFFRQVRVGQGNRQFRIFKFRSMYHETTDQAGEISASRTDIRVTRVGRFIRRTSIDELPQLLNVLRGEMSMVGPRPHALGSLAGDRLFWQASQQYWLRHALKPGITGLAQIRGLRGATDRREDLEQRVRCDLEYLSQWSLWTDVMILLKTIPVLMHKNAY